MKTYTEEDLRSAYRTGFEFARQYFLEGTSDELDEDDYIENLNKLNLVEEEQKEIPITYGLIKAKVGWSEFAEVCNRNVYAVAEFGDYEDREVFYITESQAKKLGFI
jgi:hypothetical protein